MRAGNLKNLIAIEERVENQDAYGEAIPTWTEVFRTKAGIYPTRGTEGYMSAEKHAFATHEIEIRYRGGVTPKHRIRLIRDGRVFDIISTLNIAERNKTLKIIVKESV